MAINKLPEFAKDGQKNTDDLNLTDGFPVLKKPARQWFNWLFNTLTSKVNEIIDADFIPKADIVNNLTTDDAKKPLSAKQAKNLQDNKLDKTANAVSSSKLETVRTVSFSGAATGSFSYDGSSNSSAILTLANSGVTANTYGASLKIPIITVNAKGLITGVSEQNIPINVSEAESIADLVAIKTVEAGMRVFVKSFHANLNLGGGDFIAVENAGLAEDGILVFASQVDEVYWVRTNYPTITPLMGGAVGDGVYDDTDGIQKCVNVARYVDMRYRKWNTTSKISVPSYRSFNLYGSKLSANNADDAIFEFAGSGENIRFDHGGGIISGVADSFLKCAGSTSAPTNASHYARQIRLDGLYVVSTTIDKFLDFKDAVRQVFMDKVHAYTKNGISAVGKCVEVKATKCIIYGATSELGTYGVKLESPAGTSYYNEGFHFTDCTIDAFDKTFDVKDIYGLSVTGGHIGRRGTGKVAVFGQPTSTHCKDIKFTGVNINGPVEFAPTGGRDYQAQFTGCVSEVCDGPNIWIKNNAASISIANHRFHTSTSGIAVVCDNNNARISISDINCDFTFVSGVQIKGANGSGCSVSGINYSGTGNAIYLERPVLLSNVPINDATKKYIQKFNTDSIHGSHIIGSNIASVNNWFAKGETGVIVCELTYTGASTSQVLLITTPAGMSIPSGTGWSSGAVMLNAVDGRVSLAIPYLVTQDISSGDITLKNDIGNTISLGYHSYFGFKRNC